MSNFADNLRRLRKSRKLTQTDLADKLGVGRSALSMYELGNREPDFETLETIADFFNVDMDFLVGREKEKTPVELDERELDTINRYRRLSEEKQSLVQAFLDTLENMS